MSNVQYTFPYFKHQIPVGTFTFAIDGDNNLICQWFLATSEVTNLIAMVIQNSQGTFVNVMFKFR